METKVFYVAVAFGTIFNPHNRGEVRQPDRRRELCGSYVPHEESTIHCT
jgi:hypothetical protein|nr:MAG TPA: hypothetical protein [Caudoviricetes sp.]